MSRDPVSRTPATFTQVDFEAFSPPAQMRRPDGRARFAFVTFLMLNDNYLPGALVLADALRRQETGADLVCLVTEEISPAARTALGTLFDAVVAVPHFYVPHARRQERQDRPYFFTRLNSLRLGADGDLGLDYEKVAVIDADVLPLRQYSHLFGLSSPAGVLNERKSHVLESTEAGAYRVPESALVSGKWGWHQIYDGVCPHGGSVPSDITDRVQLDPSNMGMNGSLFVFCPSRAELEDIRRDVERPEVRRLVGDLFDWPDMQYLTMRWSGHWHSIDVRFSGLNGYPDLSVLCGTHFAGFKPWYFHRAKAMARYTRYPDFQCWFRQFLKMMEEHPQLAAMGKLTRLRAQIEESCVGVGSKVRPRSSAAGDGCPARGHCQGVRRSRRP